MDNVTWYHGSPHPMVVGEVVRPGVMERNFKQSPPQQVSLTSEPWNALRWAREAAKNLGVDTIYVYRVEPSESPQAWNVQPRNYGMDTAYYEARCSSARVLEVLDESGARQLVDECAKHDAARRAQLDAARAVGPASILG